MTHHPQYPLAQGRAVNGDAFPDPATEPSTGMRPKASSPSATRNWAWGRAHEPYDWMNTHTPGDNPNAWR
jgi:hypothetical protein